MMKMYYNGTILTMEDDNQLAEALIEKDGKIVFVGDQTTAEAMLTEPVEWIDLKGYTLMPALIDAHGHLCDTAKQLKTIDLSEAKNHHDIAVTIKDYLKKHQSEGMSLVVGTCYDHNFLEEKTYPNKKILDEACPDLPLVIWHTSLHMCVVNSKLLSLLGIDADTPEPEDGAIGRMKDSMEPDGYLEERPSVAVRVLMEEAYQLTTEDLEKAQQLYMANGILTVQDGASTEDSINLLKQAGAEGKLQCDVVAYPCFNFGSGIGGAITDNPNYLGKYVNHLKIGGYKLLLDGSPQGRSAWLSEPYEGEESYCGYPWLSDEAVEGYVRQAFEDKLQLLTHCNGDAASEQFLNAYEKVAQSYPILKDKLRPVMIHCQTVRDDQLRRMHALSMIASIFVSHVYYWGDVHLINLGKRRAAHISPVRAAIDEGVMYNFHTDTPVVKPYLFHAVWAAVNRLTKQGVCLGKDQCIDVYQALKAVTINAAYSYFEEDDKGSLKIGKCADMIIIDGNPLTMHPMNLQNIKVLGCIKAGQTVYTNPAHDPVV